MNKFGFLSLLMAGCSAVIFLILRGPEADIFRGVTIFTVFSLAGLLFAVLSRAKMWMAIGFVLNGCVLVVAFLLLLAQGIGEA